MPIVVFHMHLKKLFGPNSKLTPKKLAEDDSKSLKQRVQTTGASTRLF